MKAKALKFFNHDQLGRVEEGTEFEATEAQLSGIRGFVEVYDNKAMPEPKIENKRRGRK